ncbi:MAG: site-specific DNA-methyltransferase [Gammaproteobacteria bacterium]|nr:site-specific DNA-methyltransferase [Gammaproteobacteria bacterium]MCY4341050.1 site-specific DNA-methyltransferase [Gammaproteobacteria bacterium]
MPTLQFKGKVFVENHHLAVPFHELRPVRDKGLSEKASLHDNLIIEGDNLASLKALLPTYHGKVKCIYIDPPYNTGKEGWAYNDKVNSPLMQDWLGRVVDRDDLTRHDKWLCMMLPRLKLLRELLSEDGVILLSIDDNEMHHLRCLMDEVFGQQNRVGQIIWHGSTDNNPTNIAIEHEYIVCYAANKQTLEEVWKAASSGSKAALQRIGAELLKTHHSLKESQQAYSSWLKEHKVEVKPLDDYKFIDEEGIYAGSRSVHNPGREGYRYDVIHPVTGKPCKQPLMGYRFPESTMDRLLAEDRVIFGADESKIIELKAYVDDYEAKLGSVIDGIDSRRGANEIRKIFPRKPQAFKNPKPSTLIAELLSFATAPDSIVLDSFAGSGTTAHAVLALNKQDGGNRRFVLIECEDYVDSITAERVRRVIQGVPSAKDEALKSGLGGSFSYFELGKPMRQESLLDGSNLPSYEKLASYVFFTATGEGFLPERIRRKDWFIGSSRLYDVFLIYEPEVETLKNMALTLDKARALPPAQHNRNRLVFAPTKYLDREFLHQYRITFQQLPFQIYEAVDNLSAASAPRAGP